MAITRVQANKLITASGTSAPSPAWGTTTTAGNLLLVLCNETGAFTGTWSTPPTGYTAFATTPLIYNTTTTDAYGLYWKIAVGSDATPGNVGTDGGTGGPWAVYTYEFASTTGWLSTPNDVGVASAGTATAATTKASGSTATLAQANELAIALAATSAAVTALTFTNSFVVDNPVSPAGYFWIGWQEVNATTALSTTASWTGSQVNGVRIATFKTAAATVKHLLASTGVGK